MLAAFLRACIFPSGISSSESASSGSGGPRVDAGILAGSRSDSDKTVDWVLEALGVLSAGRVSAALARSALASAVGRVGTNGVAKRLNTNGVIAYFPPSSGNSSSASGSSLEEVLPLTCVCSPLDAAVLLKLRVELPAILLASVCSACVAG